MLLSDPEVLLAAVKQNWKVLVIWYSEMELDRLDALFDEEELEKTLNKGPLDRGMPFDGAGARAIIPCL